MFIFGLNDPTRDLRQDYLMVRAVASGANPYQRQDQLAQTYAPELALTPVEYYHDDRPSPHPPVAVLLLLPLALVPYPVAGGIWLAFEMGLLGVTVFLIARLDETTWSAGLQAVAWGLAMVLAPVLAELGFGQLCLLLSALILGGWSAITRGHEYRGAALIAVAAGIKMSPLLLFGWFVLHRRWRALFFGAAVFAAAHVLTLAVLGPDALLAYVTEALPGNGVWVTDERNLSLLAVAARVFVGGNRSAALVPLPYLAMAAQILAAGVVLALTLHAQRRGAESEGFAALICAMVLLTPTVWLYWYVLLLWPGWLVYRRGATVGFLLALLLTMAPRPWIHVDLPRLLLANHWLMAGAKLAAPAGFLISVYVLVPLYLLGRLSTAPARSPVQSDVIGTSPVAPAAE